MRTNTRHPAETSHQRRRRRRVLPQSSLNSIRLGVIPEDESPCHTSPTKQTSALPSDLTKIMQKYQKQQRRTLCESEPKPKQAPSLSEKGLPANLLKVMTRYKANPPELSQRKSSAGSAA